MTTTPRYVDMFRYCKSDLMTNNQLRRHGYPMRRKVLCNRRFKQINGLFMKLGYGTSEIYKMDVCLKKLGYAER